MRGQIDQPATDLAQPTGLHQRGSGDVFPVAHHNVPTVFDFDNKGLEQSWLIRKIGIEERNGSTLRLAHPGPHCATLASVFGESDNPGASLLGNVGGGIA